MSIFKNIVNFLKKEENYRFRPYYKKEFIELKLEKNDEEVLIDTLNDKIYNYFLGSDIFEISDDKSYLKLYYDSIYLIEEEYLDFFSLPEYFTGYIIVDTKGYFQAKSGIKYTYKITDNVKVYNIKKENIIESGAVNKILPEKQYNLIKEINLYNNGENTKIAFEQYKIINKINKIRNSVDIIVSDYLKNNDNLEVIDSIMIDFIENKNGDIELVPYIEKLSEEENRVLKHHIRKSKIAKSYYEIEFDNKKIKIAIDETIKKTIKAIKKYDGKISKSEFINRSSGFFEEEVLESENISLNYGPRVKGLGYLSYRPTPPLNNSDIDWFNKELPMIYTDEEPISLTPEHLPYLEEQLKKTYKDSNVELEFSINNEKRIISLSKENLTNEIIKLKNSIKEITDYKKSKQLKEILSLMKDNEENNYIEYKGNYIKYIEPSTGWVEDYLKSLISKEENGGKNKKKKEKVLLLEDNINQVDYMEEYKDKKEDNFELIIPNSLKSEIKLLEHQKYGIKRLEFLYCESKINGILFADDMGLGKTVQILVFLAYLKEINELSPSLIVLPTSLIVNWQNEIKKFFKPDTFRVKSIKGKINDRTINGFNDYDLILTSYETLRINHVKTGKIKWSVIVCDEAQKIKNPNTLVTTSVKTQNVRFKIVSTATPIENTLQDLWCLVDFAKPGLLYSLKEFKKRYLNKKTRKKENSLFEEKSRDLNDALQNKLGKSFIRRMKDEALNDNDVSFPEKIIKYIEIKPSDKQIENLNILKNVRDEGMPVLPIIQGMLMSCSHPKLTSGYSIDFNEELLLGESKKLTYIRNILVQIKEKNEKVIIFTKYKKMQIILSIVINKWFSETPKIINGESNTNAREKVLNEFKKAKGFKVMILSPEAAGVGLNITEANHVIHYTRHWNPAKEEQATDRAYRIGQKKDVFVYYPIVSFNNNREEVKEFTFRTTDDWINSQINIDTTKKSPEEKLNKLLLKKKRILKDFFFAATIESTGQELEKELFKNTIPTNNNKYLNIADIDNIKWELFEALSVLIIEKLFKGHGYLTNKGSDRGIDGLVFSPTENLLIQSKKSISKIGNKAFNEISGGKVQYEAFLKIKFNRLFIITNAEITQTLKEIKDKNLVEIIGRKELSEFLNNNKIKFSELIEKNRNRYNLQTLKNILSNI